MLVLVSRYLFIKHLKVCSELILQFQVSSFIFLFNFLLFCFISYVEFWGHFSFFLSIGNFTLSNSFPFFDRFSSPVEKCSSGAKIGKPKAKWPSGAWGRFVVASKPNFFFLLYFFVAFRVERVVVGEVFCCSCQSASPKDSNLIFSGMDYKLFVFSIVGHLIDFDGVKWHAFCSASRNVSLSRRVAASLNRPNSPLWCSQVLFSTFKLKQRGKLCM